MKITIENANVMMREMDNTGDTEGQAKAWRLVFNFCKQQGMDYPSDIKLTGIQKVIKFIGESKLTTSDESQDNTYYGNDF